MSEAVASEIEVLRNKITLYEGNHKAHYEGMEWTIKHNKDLLSKLRTGNKELQKQLRFKAEEGDMVSQAFENLGKTLPTDYRNVSVLQVRCYVDLFSESVFVICVTFCIHYTISIGTDVENLGSAGPPQVLYEIVLLRRTVMP